MDPPPPAPPPYIPPAFTPSAPPAPAAAPAPAATTPIAVAAPASASVNEAQNHTTHVAANPSPSVAPAHNHPSYAEMIYTAIGALKEKDGSSRIAIAKYIENTYTDLPPTHSALLTHHLKRLKNSGHLLMVKKSYKIAGSGDPPADPIPSPATLEGSETKRRRGRPPKVKGEVPVPVGAALTGLAGAVQGIEGPDAGPIPVPLTEPLAPKRGRGRPRKSGAGAGAVKGRVGPPKKRAGRPPKLNVGPVLANGVQNGSKPRGRPRKNAAVVGGVGLGIAVGVGPVAVPGKRRGRPPGGGVAKRPRVAQHLRKSSGRPVGRPRKSAGVGTSAVSGGHISNDDFRRKLEYMQLKIKEAVGVLRPHLTSSISAVDAIQELEAVASMDINAVPFIDSVSAAPN